MMNYLRPQCTRMIKPTLLILFLLSTATVFGQAPARVVTTWQVQKYDLNLTLPLDERSRSVTAKAVLTVKNVSGSPASTITLRISPLAEITSVQVNGTNADSTKSEEKINSGTSLQRSAIRVGSIAPAGIATISVDYKLTIKDNSAVGMISPGGSQMLPLSFWYPTPNSWFYTRGADAAVFKLKVTASPGLSVVSAGRLTDGGFDQNLNAQPFFIAGNWDVIDQSGTAVHVPKGTGAEGQKRAAELAALFVEAKTFVAAVLGKAPDVPIRIVSSRRGGGFASAGMLLVDEGVFRRQKIDSLTAMNLAEAAAKLWLGNAIVVSGDGYGVISEGLSRYLATQFIESKFGKDVADVERLRQRSSYAGVSKRDAPMATVSPIDDFYYPEVANKGAMAWRVMAKRLGAAKFSEVLKAGTQDGDLNLGELREALAEQKPLFDYFLDKVSDINLLAGKPVVAGGETKVALRNTGTTDVTVDVSATTQTGEKLVVPTTINATSYGEVVFRTNANIVRVEVDADKLYPQIDYSDDIAPRDTTDSDPLLAAKRLFDKQEFAGAEILSRSLLRDVPRFDDLRILLARSLLAQTKNAEAEREFKTVLDEKLPTSRSLAWASVGLAEIASRAGQNDSALRYADQAITADAEYGASLAARNVRSRLNIPAPTDVSVKEFFAAFDKAASANRKADVDALVLPGEVTKFSGGVAGSTEQWQTQVRYIDRIDANTVLVEANMSIKLLNKEAETGIAVYRLTKAGNAWKLSAVEMFEVR